MERDDHYAIVVSPELDVAALLAYLAEASAAERFYHLAA
jgi:hypothetical protein